jgi:hypothetical protein
MNKNEFTIQDRADIGEGILQSMTKKAGVEKQVLISTPIDFVNNEITYIIQFEISEGHVLNVSTTNFSDAKNYISIYSAGRGRK